MQANVSKARDLVAAVIPALGGARPACAHGCDRALEHAIITAPEARDPDLAGRLDAVAGRVL
jgi:5'-methylthioadenosine phosphorylase